MSGEVIQMATIAKPSISDIFEEFLNDQKARLAPKTLRKYEEVIDLLRSHLDEYGHDGLSTAERALFERYYNLEGEEHRDYCDLFGPEKIFDSIASRKMLYE